LGEEIVSDNAEKDENKLDWVAERSDCSLDVKIRNSLRPDLAPYEFSIEENLNKLAVHMRASDFQRSVTFCLEEHAILVLDNGGNQLFEVTLTFTDDGKCRMNAKQQSRESWQVRRMALEDLLFRSL
jgi:hypothetical protein